jgi:hypothetical protein
MSQKHARSRLAALTSPTARRVGMGVVIAGLGTTLVFVFLHQRNEDDSVDASVSPPISTTTVVTPPAAINGIYDVVVTVTSAEYGASWPGTQLVAGQQLTQTWSMDCRHDTCELSITSGHVVEDPDAASVSTTDNRTFSVSGSTPAAADTASSPPGCGSVDATDLQRLTLTAAPGGATFGGVYELHHPTIHVEGPVGAALGTCDSFNVVLDITATRHA